MSFQSPSTLITNADTFQKLSDLYQLQYTLNRMAKNIGLIDESPNAKIINVSNTTLFYIAAQQYGDANLWAYLANVNNLSDPEITTAMTLIIPPKPSSAVELGE